MKSPRELTESQVWLAEQSSTGFLVALWLDPEVASKLAIKGGEAASDLHVTLAYCGDFSEMDELVQARVITAIDETVRYRDRLEGEISGYGRFISTEDDGKDVFYLTPDVPQLAELRQCIITCLMDKGVYVSTDHGYTPHITLAYLDPGDPNPLSEVEDTSLLFEAVTIMSGSRRIDVPFWKPESPYTLSEKAEIPLNAPLGTQPARALYFGSFDKEWIPFLPKPGKYIHDFFGNLDFTPETYSDILSNFDKYVYKQDLPIKATHTDPAAGAVGWIRPGGLRLAEDGSIEARPEWNELGKGLVEDDRFLYTSAEFCKVWTNPVTQEKIPNVAVGLALVTRPHFKTDVLNPLSESEALAFAESSGTTGEGTTMTEKTPVVVADPAAAVAAVAADPFVQATPAVVATPAAVAAPAANPLDPNNSVVLSDLTQVVITAQQRTTERQMFADLTARVELAERRATTAEAELKRIGTEKRVDKFKAEVLGRSAENGQPWFGPVQQNVDHLVSLAETYGDDSAEVRWAVTQKRNEAQAIRNTGIFDPISIGVAADGASASAQVTHLAEQNRLADPALSADQAIAKAYEENPELYLKSIKK